MGFAYRYLFDFVFFSSPKMDATKKAVWFQLLDEGGKPFQGVGADKVFVSPVADVVDFREAVHAECAKTLQNVDALKLKVFKDETAFKDNEPLLPNASITAELGATMETALLVMVPGASGIAMGQRLVYVSSMHTAEMDLDGLVSGQARFKRPQLIEKIHQFTMKQTFTLISSPSASGKTSLIDMFMEALDPTTNVTKISCVRPQSLRDLLLLGGIDISTLSYSPPANGHVHYIMLDDAQKKYDDETTWTTLIKAMRTTLYENRCFVVISAVYSFKPGVVSPAAFGQLLRVTSDDLLLNHDESIDFIADPSIGLHEKFAEFTLLKNMIAVQCGGLIGALKISCSQINIAFSKEINVKESDALQLFLSKTIMGPFSRCFGSPVTLSDSGSAMFLDFLARMFLNSVDSEVQIR